MPGTLRPRSPFAGGQLAAHDHFRRKGSGYYTIANGRTGPSRAIAPRPCLTRRRIRPSLSGLLRHDSSAQAKRGGGFSPAGLTVSRLTPIPPLKRSKAQAFRIVRCSGPTPRLSVVFPKSVDDLSVIPGKLAIASATRNPVNFKDFWMPLSRA